MDSASAPAVTEHGQRHPHPALFGVLVMPFGLAVGYAQVAVPYILSKKYGLEIAVIATVSAVSSLPHGWKFLWAPALDVGWRRRSFYLGSIALTAVTLALTALIPPVADKPFGVVSLFAVYTAMLAAAQAAVATSSAAVDALMAITLPDNKKGAASGWYNAGNLGGTGIGGAVALWFSQHLSASITALMLFGVCVACGLPALSIDEPQPERHPLGAALKRLGADVWTMVKSRHGWTGLVICFSPVGTGAAANLFSAVAGDYGAGEHHVEIVNGVLGGLVAAAGCLFGGYLADRMNRRLSYVLAGALTGAVAAFMAVSPATPISFTIGCLAYSFASGIAYAAFTAFVLEMIGHSPGVTTKYSLLVGLSNQAISYVTWLDGRGYEWGKHSATWSGRAGLLGMDAATSFVGILVLGAMFFLLSRSSSRDPAAG